MDEASVPAVGAAAGGDAAAEADRLAGLLAGHDPVLPGGRAICKHGDGRGTVSSTVLAVPEEGMAGALFRFAAGPPCRTPWEEFGPLARSLAP